MLASNVAATDTGCDRRVFDRDQRIRSVIDGDTVILADGEHLRLIGIDAPEIGRADEASQPGAEAAYIILTRLLATENHIGLVFGPERRDRYNRLLAHLFLPDGTNLQARILIAGFAVPLTVPPNVAFAECYGRLADDAQRKKTGIWALPQYQIRAANDLRLRRAEYGLVQGTVNSVQWRNGAIWLNLGPRFAVKVNNEDADYFDRPALEKLMGTTITVRGYIRPQEYKIFLRLRHPIDLLSTTPAL